MCGKEIAVQFRLRCKVSSLIPAWAEEGRRGSGEGEVTSSLANFSCLLVWPSGLVIPAHFFCVREKGAAKCQITRPASYRTAGP